MNPRSKATFDAGHVDTYDLRLLDSPSQITMLRIGIANDDWCIKKVELLFNGRVAFARDAVPGGSACVMVDAGTYLEFTSSDLRSDPRWVGYGTPPALPKGLSAADLKTLVTSVTGSAMLNSPGYAWDLAVPLVVARTTSSTFKVSYGIVITDPSGIEARFTARIGYEVRLFVGTDGRLHATKMNASCCYHGQMSDAVVAQLNAALGRMTARPQPNPLSFGIDAFTNVFWRYIPVIG